MNPLNFPIQQQLCDQWCWASVASAVCACYNDPNAPDQRGVVNLVLGNGSGDCDCQEDPTVTCNQPQDLSFVLANIQHAGAEVADLQFTQVMKEINRGRPIVVQVTLTEPATSNHAVAIYGYTAQGSVLLADPMHADDIITVSLNDFVSGSPTAFHGAFQTAFLTIPR
jgi:Peptidase_C39 like family